MSRLILFVPFPDHFSLQGKIGLVNWPIFSGSGSEFFESGSEEESCNLLSSDEEQSVEMIEHMLVGAASLHMEVATLEI